MLPCLFIASLYNTVPLKHHRFGLTNLPERYLTLRGLEFFGRMNLLKGGILYADRITTVSERFRREMLTPDALISREIWVA